MGWGEERDHWGGCCSGQGDGAGGGQGTGSKGAEKWLDSGFILKVEQTGLAEGLGMAYETQRRKDYSEGLSSEKDGIGIY